MTPSALGNNIVDAAPHGASESDLRERLVTVTIELLTTNSPSTVSLREIARRAGVSHGAPLYHFPSLTALLTEVAAEGFRRVSADTDQARAALDEGASPRERIITGTRAYVRFALANPGLYRLMFQHDMLDLQSPSFIEAATEHAEHATALLSAYQGAGWHPELPLARLVLAYWAAVHGTILAWDQRVMQDATGDDTIDDMLGAVLTVNLGPDPDDTARRDVVATSRRRKRRPRRVIPPSRG